ncbi:MAG: succinylglutamate desuccinylase/aspartoacylase family protein, partial [Gammaproteobacteria bacterium]|nr:succinylglutamate desuccinylase/aspartoacylase family protein [Gammaproteobacteria bacterium]
MKNGTLVINDITIKPGTRMTIDLPAARLYTHAPMSIPVHVVSGKTTGPRLFLSAAIHGDEINGIEIIRRLLKLPALKRLQGTLIAVPMVNVHGIINHSRYLPDRRDLNRSFPGSEKGPLALRLANLFMKEIVEQSTHGIDLHTGAIHRSNLPQIRANLDNDETEKLARAFDVPVIISSNLRDGSLREAAAEFGIPMLLYEAGEALRFDEVAIRAGVKG